MGEKDSNLKLLTSLVGLFLLPALLIFININLYSSFISLPVNAIAAENILLSAVGPPPEKPVTFLLYGIDAGEWVGGTFREGTGRADTIVLIQADPLSQRAALLSIPRDTLVEIPGRSGDDKINHAYAFGQVPLLVKTVEGFTGVPVDHYVGLNYRAFKDVVDLLGGVEFDVDRLITSRGLRLEPGLQHLNGDASFALVSFRNEPMGDIGRVQRQQRFIKAVVARTRQSSLDQIFYTLLATWDNIDTDLNIPEALVLKRALAGITEEDMDTEIVPGWFYNRGGISYWRPYPEETAQLLNSMFKTVYKDNE